MHTNVREVVIFDPHEDIISYNVGGTLGLTGGATILERFGFMQELKQHSYPFLATYHDDILLEISSV